MSRPALPARKVSRNRKVGQGKQQPVKVAIIRFDDGLITCSCGWAAVHQRNKVREEKAQRHLDKRHKGEGMWL